MEYKKLEVITGEQLAAFHTSKKVLNASCLRCGRPDWKLLSHAAAPMHGLPTARDESAADVNLFTPLIVLACSNCGTIWEIAYPLVHDWLIDNRKES